ncbi:MAG: SPOR domain-containing protein [Roseofilum sp. SBFL]|uniref:SPOR domain-containing protein n=1 Tax=unclassified Roseofilum TaxID=2620099 RepID=UPI001B1D409B|nr:MULTISPECIES: SPOR domain-containing protein [unclassified Roseofilum]MBP0014528.1 SPOR domain-containing protein [Roseofilum sp. SID3]MBP0024393.1 SPOR domain-containing protein [Roseofilum sp. SID2]MBP0037765.1 SPOR domain-containing protein [Roseofilum sp. SID1]MBP0040567.1 SPOR domain-containing protein [Roseofilum sp. SBFL]
MNNPKQHSRLNRVILLGSLGLGLMVSTSAQSQQVPLPPPPPLNAIPTIPGNINSPYVAPSAYPYRVWVNGNSPLLLEQVKQLVPDAFIRQIGSRTVIQAGAFVSEFQAQERLSLLRSRGILAEVVSLQGDTLAGGPNYLPPNYPTPVTPANTINPNPVPVAGKGYYVVIPSPQDDANLVANRVRQIIPNTVNVVAKRSRRGMHVAVGPYANRSEAAEIMSLLQNSGLSNARVYFGR